MKIYSVILGAFLLGACSLKDQAVVDANLKSQTLMFMQKYKITKDQKNAVVTLAYLNPVLDYLNKKEDIFVLGVTPDFFNLENLNIYVNAIKANIENIDKNNELIKYVIENQYTKYYKISSLADKSKKTLKVKICLEDQFCFELDFQKYPKSLYYRSVDVDTQYN